MKRCYILFVFIVLISCDSANKFESPAENYFVKFYGEDGDHEGVDFIANSDGTFVLLGNERKPGSTLGQQIFLVRVDAQGMVIGEPRTFGSTGDDFAKDIELTPDGNIIVAGESQTGTNNRDVFVFTVSNSNDLNRLDSIRVSGVLKTPSGQESDEEVKSISVISNGYIVAGSTTAVGLDSNKFTENDITDALHLRFDNNLVLVSTDTWTYTTGKDDGTEVLVKMIEISPSMYYGFAYTNVPEPENNLARNYKYWGFSIGSAGGTAGYDEIFTSGNAVDNSILSSVLIKTGEGYVLSGVKTNTSDQSQSYLLRLSNTLEQGQNNVLNEETPTDLGLNVGGKTSMTILSQGGYLLLANNNQPPSDNLNISLIKLSSTLKTEWQEQILFGGVGDDFAGSVTELPDGKIIVIGTMTLGGVSGQTKMVLMKLNKDGKLVE